MNLPCTFQTAQLIENLRIVLNFSSQSSKHTIYFATLPFLLEPFIVFVSFYTEKTVVIRQISTKLVSLFKTIDSKHQRMSRIFSIMLETNPHHSSRKEKYFSCFSRFVLFRTFPVSITNFVIYLTFQTSPQFIPKIQKCFSLQIFSLTMPKSLVKVRVPLDSVFSVILKM